MTIPIARLVATRYAGRRAAAAPLLLRPRLPRGPTAARAAARVPAGRARADRRPRRPRATAEVIALCARGARRGRAAPRTGSGSATASLYRALLDDARGAARTRHRPLLEALSRARPRRARARVARAGPGRAERDLLVRAARSCAAGREVLDAARTARWPRRSRACARCTTLLARARRRRPRDLRPRPGARARLLHGRGLRGLRPRGRPRARRRRPLRRPARPLRPRRCPPAASRSTCSACTSRRPRRRRSR